jgi:TatA/E family protein of Tat protein translocase
MLSLPHLVVVFVIALVVFGPQKLPELARTLGKLMAEFRKASSDFRSAFEEEMRDLERQARETERKLKEAARLPSAPTPPSSADTPSGAAMAEEGTSSVPEAAGGEWIDTSLSSSEAVLTDSPQQPDLSPRDVEAGLSHRPDDDSDPHSDNGSSSSPTKPNHVDRQPA